MLSAKLRMPLAFKDATKANREFTKEGGDAINIAASL